MTGIYKITNLINNQCYIGQAVDIESRWARECLNAIRPQYKAYNYPLSKDLREFGKENFSFEILEECNIEELDEREKYWIKYYDSFHNGYNQTIGGEGIHKISSEILKNIRKDLSENILDYSELSEKYLLNINTLYRINSGRMYFDPTIIYPLRKNIQNNSISAKNNPNGICQKCGKSISEYACYCKECYAILNRKVERPSKEKLENYLYSIRGNFSKAGREFGVSDNAIRKWCKSYNLPTVSKAYKIIEKNPNLGKTIPKGILQLDLNNNIIAEYSSILQACKAIGKLNGGSHLTEVCNGKRKTAYGYIWKFKTE